MDDNELPAPGPGGIAVASKRLVRLVNSALSPGVASKNQGVPEFKVTVDANGLPSTGSTPSGVVRVKPRLTGRGAATTFN